ncbi:MAG: hypothetical protein M3083_08345 [Actinomycetota bacterium]|nr:hypothetical protein [Actinomycetota bacterium]MDQ6948812.1 hypothetical protein [Actinomycetota bacterium]
MAEDSTPRVEADRFNPFGVNRVGLNGPGFPLSIDVTFQRAMWTAHGTALRAKDLAALVVRLSGPVVLVFNIGHTAWSGEDGALLAAGEIANRQQVPAEVHDMRWAALAPQSTGLEVLVMAASDIPAFFADWSLYDVDLLDLPEKPTVDELDEIVLAVNTWRPTDPPVLCSLDKPTVYFGGHDDCYFYVESRSPRLPQLILCRLLALLAGAALIEGEDAAEIPEPGEDFAANLLSLSKVWVGRTSSPDGDELRIDLSPRGWRLGQPIPYEPSQVAILNLSAGEWTLRPTRLPTGSPAADPLSSAGQGVGDVPTD